MIEAYDNTEIDYIGRELRIEHHFDCDSGAPWEVSDGHGDVSGWTLRSKRPGERVLHTNSRNSRFKRYYDFQGAIKKARTEGWGLTPEALAALTRKLQSKPTKHQIYAEAVERDFRYLRGWCNAEWHWMGVVVTDIETGESESLWGIESSDEDYIRDVERQLCEQVYIPSVRALIANVE